MMPEDWTEIRDLMIEVRDQNAVSITIRRGDTTLAAQTARVEGMGTLGRVADSAGGQESTGTVVVLGDTTLDIQPGDRFTVAGILYEVILVHPNKRAATQAEAKAVE